MDERDRRAEAREVVRFFHRRVAAADDDDVFVAEECAVADRACADALVLELVFALETDVVRARAGRGDDRFRQKHLLVDPNFEGARREVDLRHVLRDDLGALVDGLLAEARHELLARHLLGEAWVVLDVAREHELTARDEATSAEAFDAERLQVRARGVDGCGQAGRTRADDDDIADFFTHPSLLGMRPARARRGHRQGWPA